MDKKDEIPNIEKFKIHRLITIDQTLREIIQNILAQIKLPKKKSQIQHVTIGDYQEGHYQTKPEHIWVERKILQTNSTEESISINIVVLEIHVKREINRNLNEEKVLIFKDGKTFYSLKIGDHTINMNFQNPDSICSNTLMKLEELTVHIQELVTKQNNQSKQQIILKLKAKTHNLIKRLFPN